ncbi:MAG: hypothetical protein FD121_596 [Gallionellaceae bacterium]|nr:MAG: hypothetical protein FD121_596 [Gallionellaceae bacterium]
MHASLPFAQKLKYSAACVVSICVVFVGGASAAGMDRTDTFSEYKAEFQGFGKGLAVVYSKIGKVQTIRTESNRHEPEKLDMMQVASLPGIKVELRQTPGAPNLPLVERLTVSQNDFRLLSNRKIGTSTTNDILNWLGQPDEKRGSSFVFRSSSENWNTFIFHFEQGRLMSVEWNWDYD